LKSAPRALTLGVKAEKTGKKLFSICPKLLKNAEPHGPGALNAEFQYFIPLVNKISCLCRQTNSQEGDEEASNEGCNLGPRGNDFTDITLLYLLFKYLRLVSISAQCPPLFVLSAPKLLSGVGGVGTMRILCKKFPNPLTI